VILGHDRDIALQHDYLDRLFRALPPGYESLSLNEYVGFLHTRIDSSDANGWEITFNFDHDYCPYFAKHASTWRLWLSDPLLDKLRAFQNVRISVDGKTSTKVKAAAFLRQKLTIDLPAGLGSHVWKLTPEQ
jgi:hypothetical protein